MEQEHDQHAPLHPGGTTVASAAPYRPLPLAERRRRAAQRQDELADILAGAAFDLFLRRVQDKHRGSRPEGNHESTN